MTARVLDRSETLRRSLHWCDGYLARLDGKKRHAYPAEFRWWEYALREWQAGWDEADRDSKVTNT